MSKDYRHPSRREQKWLDAVLNPEPEPRPHSCGRCRTPWGVTNPNCPGRAGNAGRTGG